MTVQAADLEGLESLAIAVGLIDESGNFREDWLTQPEFYLTRALANDTQRSALIHFLDEALGGGSAVEDTRGRLWLPIVSIDSPPIAFSVVVDEAAATHVRIGLGVSIETTAPVSRTRFHLPLFRTAKTGHSISSPLLLGSNEGCIEFTTDITVDTTAPTPGVAHLGSVGLTLQVPTASGGEDPSIAISMGQLQLPGATEPQNLNLSLDSLDTLDDQILEIVMGMIQAQANISAGTPLASLAGLLGLRGDVGLPDLPIAALAIRGPIALVEWFDQVISNSTNRIAWLGQLAALLGGSASVAGDKVSMTLGPASVLLGISVHTSNAGHHQITPTLGVRIASGDLRAEIAAELVRLDLGDGSAFALPRLSMQAVTGQTATGGAPVLTGNPAVAAVRAGIELNEDRRPTLVLAADQVVIGSNQYDTLDLTSPDAIADAAGTLVDDVLDSLLAQLGPLGTAIRPMLGLSPPPGFPAVPTASLTDFMRNPLTSIGQYWRTLVTNHTAAVPALLALIRPLLADTSVATLPVSGVGTQSDPWRLSMLGPVELQLIHDPAANSLTLLLASQHIVDSLGLRCTRIQTRVALGLLEIGLVNGQLSVANRIDLRMMLRARGSAQARLNIGPLAITADHLGFVTQWKASSGFSTDFLAPNLGVEVTDTPIPVGLPQFNPDGSPDLDAAGFVAVERLIGLLASQSALPGLRELVAALGWFNPEHLAGEPGSIDQPKLPLADLVADPATAIPAWMKSRLLSDSAGLQTIMSVLSRLLTGTAGDFGLLSGEGRPDDPYRLGLFADGLSPELACWFEPHGPLRATVTDVPDVMRFWQPGSPGLDAAQLAESLLVEGFRDHRIASLTDGRALFDGLRALIDRWRGTDGFILPPTTDPAGVTVHRVADATVSMLANIFSIETLFNSVPATILNIEIVPSDAPFPWPDAPIERVIDLREADRIPGSFALPVADNGEWFVALAPRAAAVLTTGDADGTEGQAQRLQRILSAFDGAGGLLLKATGGAGHATRLAADRTLAVNAVITLGTAPGPVAFTVLDVSPAAEVLRMLISLLPKFDNTEPDDSDLALGRSLINGLDDLLRLADPAVDLRPPVTALPAPRAGLDVHAIFGELETGAIEKGLTAVVAAALSNAASQRFDRTVAAPITAAGMGIRLPITSSSSNLQITGEALVECLHVDLTTPLPAFAEQSALLVNLSIQRNGGWLIGGPDPERGPGARPAHELRSLQVSLRLPLHGNGDASAELSLVEPRVFGIARPRWIVSAEGASSANSEVVTPALPEVGVLLAQVAEILEGATEVQMIFFRDLLVNSNLLHDSGGFNQDGIDHFLHAPAEHFASVLADQIRSSNLDSAINGMLDTVPGLAVQLASKQMSLDLQGTPGSIGLAPWQLHLDISATSAPNLAFTVGSVSQSAAGGMGLSLSTQPFSIHLDRYQSDLEPRKYALWPAPDPELGKLALYLAPAELARIGLSSLRDLDEGARPIVDAAFDSLGLLTAVASDGSREVTLPSGLLENPLSWLRHQTALGGQDGLNAAKLIQLMDAFKPLLGVSGVSGEWQLAPGVSILAEDLGGVPHLSLALDTSGFTAPASSTGRLALSANVGLTLPEELPPQPDISLAIGVAGAVSGRRALHLTLANGLRVFLRPTAGADLPLYPNPPGLAALSQTAVTHALPIILDALADETGNDLAGKSGAIVRAVGDAMALRNVAGKFDSARLQSWAVDPAGQFATRLPTLTTLLINELGNALDPLLPPEVVVSASATDIVMTVGGTSISLQTTPFEVAVATRVSGLQGVREISMDARFNTTGLLALSFEMGPAALDVGGTDLRPYVRIAAGQSPPGGRSAEVGLALDIDGIRRVGGRWLIESNNFDLIAVDGVEVHIEPLHVVPAMVEATLQMIANFAMSTLSVTQLLNSPIPNTVNFTVRNMMAGVLLEDTVNPNTVANDLFDLSVVLQRMQKLMENIADAGPSFNVSGGLTVGMSRNNSIIQFTLGLTDRFNLTEQDLVVALEADSRWIRDTPTAGLSIGLLDTSNGFSFRPSLSVDGLGIRVGRLGAPLLDSALGVGSVAVHVFARVSEAELSGGMQLQLSELSVGVSGGTGGNPVAQGLLTDTGSGENALAPTFSPAFAVQKHGSDPVMFGLRAGEGDGPWWLSIQKGFGPLYIEQIGLDTTLQNDQLIDISVLLDGGVSIAGLAAEVDDLSLTFVVGSDASIFDPARWRVDLAGLAVSADLAGISLAGGLRKFGSGADVEYIGMLLARFATYGLSVFGGYGTGEESGTRFTSFFAFGAINGPIGGPPAFFLTGIGGGIGINRDLIIPQDMSRFGDFPFIQALDPAASPPENPMAALETLRNNFPMKRGDFWFAAGLSFTSFALVDGVVVVAVKVGDGLEISMLGLARMALPRPQIALVSIELGLIARFSTEEGVLWVQAQLTENSWLLHESVRLTGGFAFVSWFDGPNSGQFVLTIGGYHPSFHRDGYPVVPRLGFRWSVSDAIVVKGESYFALTSEAVMAGAKLEASAEFGPAWAHVVFGADGIVYFDPFRFEVTVYASISAGITIDFWIGSVTISIHIGASIEVIGPKIRGVATFEIGPVELSVAFGETPKEPKVYLGWNDFVSKYLEEASPGVARCVTALPGKGALVPGTGSGGATDTGTADGSLENPFVVLSEFEFTITSTIPSRSASFSALTLGGQAPSEDIGLGPMNQPSISSVLGAKLRDKNGVDRLGKLDRELRFADGFPKGVWGNPQADDDRKIPKGDVIRAIEGAMFEAVATIEGSLPKEMNFKQVDSDERKPLPFLKARIGRASLIADAAAVASIIPAVESVKDMYATAVPWLEKGGNSATALAALERDRAAPPVLGYLAEDLADAEPEAPVITFPEKKKDLVIDRVVAAPEVVALLSAELVEEIGAAITSVRQVGSAVRMAPPTLSGVEQQRDWVVPAKLILVDAPAVSSRQSVRPVAMVPYSRSGHAGTAAVHHRSASIDGQGRLLQLSESLVKRGTGASLLPGEVAVMCLPNAVRDIDSEVRRPTLSFTNHPARVMAMAMGGHILHDRVVENAEVIVPQGTERLVVVAGVTQPKKAETNRFKGWHAGQSVAFVGWSTALVRGGSVFAEGASVSTTGERFRAGWISACDFVGRAQIVKTRFEEPAQTVVVALDHISAISTRDVEAGLSMTLQGATQQLDAQGQSTLPTLISEGSRSYLVYTVERELTKEDAGFDVSIASESAWQLAAVMASSQDSEEVIDQLLDVGLDTLLPPLTASRTGAVTFAWRPSETQKNRTRGGRKITKKKPVVITNVTVNRESLVLAKTKAAASKKKRSKKKR